MAVELKDKVFNINGKKEFIYGGEFHYFRCPQNEWEDRIDKIKDAGCNLVSTYIPWRWHEKEEGKIDLTGQTRSEKDLESFLKLVKEKGLYCIVRPGPYVMAEIKDAGIPEWLLGNYPEVLARDEEGRPHPSRIVSFLHPLYLEKVKEWYHQVCKIIVPFQVTENGPVFMFQLDNEIGMFHWVSNTSDYSQVTLQYFQDYLNKHYQSLKDLNKAYGLNASSFEEFTFEKRKHLSDTQLVRFHWDWGRFMRSYFKLYADILKGYSKEFGINVPYIINVHGFSTYELSGRGKKYPIGLSQLYQTLDEETIFAGDYYIGNINYDNFHDLVIAGEFTKAIQPESQPYFSAEFQSGRLSDRPKLQPQDVDLSARLCIAHDMNAINYYMFVGGENYEDIGIFGRRHEWQAPIDTSGNFRPQYKLLKHLGKVLTTFSDQLVGASKEKSTYLGFYPDYYMTEFKNQATSEMIKKIEHYRDTYQFDGMVRLLSAASIPYGAYDVLKDDRIPVDEISSLWMFSTDWMAEDIQKKLVRYVEEGGKLVIYPVLPRYNLEGEDCTILADTLLNGSWDIKPGNGKVSVMGMEDVHVSQRMVFKECPGKPIAWYEHEDGKRDYSAFIQNNGEGTVVVFGLGLIHDFHYKLDIIERLAEELELERVIESSNNNLITTVRSNGDTHFVFINNFEENEQTGKIKYKGQSLFNNREIKVPARTGLILPVNLEIDEKIKIEYSTLEIFDIKKTDEEYQLKMVTRGVSGEITFKGDNISIEENENYMVNDMRDNSKHIVINSSGNNEIVSINIKLK